MTEITEKGWEQHAEACRKRLAQGDSSGAEQSFAAAMAEGEALGSNSAGLAACLTVLAQIRTQQRDHAAAERLFRRALEAREAAAEFDHTGVIQILGHLATLHNARADYDEAESLLLRALTLADKFLTSAHPAVASLLNNLARLYFKRAEHAKADRMLVRLLQIKQALGTEHPEVAGVLASIAALRSALGKHDVAEQLWRRVLAIREKSLAPSDPALVSTLNSLADACAAQGDNDEATHFRERGLRLHATAPADVASSRDRAPAARREGTPANVQRVIAPPGSIGNPTPVEVQPAVRPMASITPIGTPAPPQLIEEAAAVPAVQHSRITPIPVASVAAPAPAPIVLEPMIPAAAAPVAPNPITPAQVTPVPMISLELDPVLPSPTPAVPAPRLVSPPFSAGTSGAFTTLTPPAGASGGSFGSASGGGYTPLAPPAPAAQPPIPSGIGAPPPLVTPARSPVQPATLGPSFGGAPTPAAPPPRAVAPPAPPPPRVVQREPTPAPPRMRAEPSLERPRYDGSDSVAHSSGRGKAGRILVGLAVAAGIGFAAVSFVRGNAAASAEASAADTVSAEPRVIRIPAESLRVSGGPSAPAKGRPSITLDSALAASRAHNAVAAGAATTPPTPDSAATQPANTIVIPSQRRLDALSRAVDASLKPSVDSALRAPVSGTPGFKTP